MILTHHHLPVLQQARALIETGAQDYICFALNRIAFDDVTLDELASDVGSVIMAGLDGCALLSKWLLEQLFGDAWNASGLPEPYCDSYIKEGGVMHLARLAWLDRLIANIQEN